MWRLGIKQSPSFFISCLSWILSLKSLSGAFMKLNPDATVLFSEPLPCCTACSVHQVTSVCTFFLFRHFGFCEKISNRPEAFVAAIKLQCPSGHASDVLLIWGWKLVSFCKKMPVTCFQSPCWHVEMPILFEQQSKTGRYFVCYRIDLKKNIIFTFEGQNWWNNKQF